jgi:hypothetical protein
VSNPRPGPALYENGIERIMQQAAEGTSTTSGPASKRPGTHLPLWSVAIIAAVAVAALTFAAILQVEVASTHSEGSGLGSSQLFDGTVGVTQDLVPGNASQGYWGNTLFSSPVGNGNPIVLQIVVMEAVGGPALTIEFDVCSTVAICSNPGGTLNVVPISPEVSETQIVLEPATGFHSLALFNLPGFADGRPVVPVSVQANVTLLGQVNLHS